MSGVNCREFEVALVEVARGGPLTTDQRAGFAAHLETCCECRKTLDAQRRLSAAASALAAETARFTVPPSVERALGAELELSRSGRRRRIVYGAIGGAIAASLAVIWWMANRPAPRIAVASSDAPVVAVAIVVPPPVKDQPRIPRHRRAVRPAEAQPEQPFIAIPYTLPLEPYERADVMRMDLPVSALIAAGLPMSMMDPGARVQTDVLVGQDGRARAIRLISFSSSN
jgi:hypothetical protein